MQAARPPAKAVLATSTPARQEGPGAGKKAWKVELPNISVGDEEFGGCRSIEHTYTKMDQIGEGTYGQVYLAKDNADGTLVALKKIRMDNEKEGFPITAIREIKLLKNLDHENVIRLKEIVRSQTYKCNNYKGSIYMVFDYMDHDLTGLMERRGYKFSPPQIKCYMKQLLAGLAYCHNNCVLHRDLKASNLLINNQGSLKLADFGLARQSRVADDSRFTNRVITLWYRPPELLLGSERYGPEIDMWSVGCIFAELLLGKPMFPGKDEADQMDRIAKVLGSPNEDNMPGCTQLPFYDKLKHRYRENRLRKHFEGAPMVTDGALDLLEQMLCLDPKRRQTAEQAFKDGYFWFAKPHTCEKKDLPSYEASHELDMKRKRHAERAAGGAGQVGPSGPRPIQASHAPGTYLPGPAGSHAHHGQANGNYIDHGPDHKRPRYGVSAPAASGARIGGGGAPIMGRSNDPADRYGGGARAPPEMGRSSDYGGNPRGGPDMGRGGVYGGVSRGPGPGPHPRHPLPRGGHPYAPQGGPAMRGAPRGHMDGTAGGLGPAGPGSASASYPPAGPYAGPPSGYGGRYPAPQGPAGGYSAGYGYGGGGPPAAAPPYAGAYGGYGGSARPPGPGGSDGFGSRPRDPLRAPAPPPGNAAPPPAWQGQRR